MILLAVLMLLNLSQRISLKSTKCDSIDYLLLITIIIIIIIIVIITSWLYN